MNKALFLDLDGTVITTKSGRTFPLHTEDWKLIPEIIPCIKDYIKKEYIVIIVTNQAGIELGYVSEKNFVTKLNNICNTLESYVNNKYRLHTKKENKNKVTINYFYCKYEESYHRKPSIGMAIEACEEYELNLSKCVMIGDMQTDKEFAYNSGIRTYYDINEIKKKYSAS